MSNLKAIHGRVVDATTGELIDGKLPVEELTGSDLERAMREEVHAEYGRLRERFGIDHDAALKMAIGNVKAAASAVADDERESVQDGGRQLRFGETR